jgi:BetI-type transcriptional repressor, C-terminal
MRHVIGTLKGGREWRPLLFEFVTYAARNPEFRERFTAGRQNVKAALASSLADRIAAHRLQPVVSPEQLAVRVSALAIGRLNQHLHPAERIPRTVAGRGQRAAARRGARRSTR